MYLGLLAFQFYQNVPQVFPAAGSIPTLDRERKNFSFYFWPDPGSAANILERNLVAIYINILLVLLVNRFALVC